jgi:hypothetical protein
MNAGSIPPPAPEDLAAERLVATVESVIAGLQERLANIAADGQDAKWSVSDLVRLLQLRDRLQGERPRTILACWVDDSRDDNNNDQQENGARI